MDFASCLGLDIKTIYQYTESMKEEEYMEGAANKWTSFDVGQTTITGLTGLISRCLNAMITATGTHCVRCSLTPFIQTYVKRSVKVGQMDSGIA